MTWTSGDRYEGQFENGLRDGQGAYYFPDGDRYEGGWKAGKQHGQGIETSADGQRIEGVWNNGKRVVAGEEAREAEKKPPRRRKSGLKRGGSIGD